MISGITAWRLRVASLPPFTEVNTLAIAHEGYPYVSVYPLSVDSFGSKYFNPSTLPPQRSDSAVFTPAGDAIAFGSATEFLAYKWSPSGFGSKYADPSIPLHTLFFA